jgi:hypothetical protein
LSNEITASKAEFALDLQNAGLDVLDYVPERIVPPIVIISSGSPYLVAETVGREFRLGLNLTLVAQTATNEEATESLDKLISDVVSAVTGFGYIVLNGVNTPYRLAANNAEYLACDLNLDLTITL